ncbi:hypothetical protein FKZ61_004170 [Litorilinea aerophila]|uniref:Uncharacterized protein n=1 Tax=Litorilinea aerophila TaxID=1204385 RepID=A0A540VKG3_9CHLR|nr:hypothetical protein [Litorilinea aerophila]MCC9075308.1 hypothetical protein [Litorilinea aerophila]GIV79312.1 MAG: hypothetical protein KatS3mg050_3706 [Litorilinea sp.]
MDNREMAPASGGVPERASYEVRDADVRAVALFGLAVLLTLLLVYGLLRLLLTGWLNQPLTAGPQVAPALVTPVAAPGPGLVAAPSQELDAYLQEQSQRLGSYGWVDREAGIVHVPITQAMEMLVEQGLPARDGPPPQFGLGPAYRLDSTGGQGPIAPGR